MPKQQTAITANSPAKRLCSFILAVCVLALVTFVLAPLPIEHFEPMTHYVQNAEANGIHPGALYYSDVSVTPSAELNSRDTVRYYYNLPKHLAEKTR